MEGLRDFRDSARGIDPGHVGKQENRAGLGAATDDAGGVPLPDPELGGGGAVEAHRLGICTRPPDRVQAYNEGYRVASGDSQESNHATLAADAMAFDAAQATYFRRTRMCW